MLKNRGFTLLEILLALVIIGIMTGMLLHFYIQEYRASLDLEKKAELQFALLRANQVLELAVRTAGAINFSADEGLAVTPVSVHNPGAGCDFFFVADKDGDGKNDLYRKHLGITNPVVTGITSIDCREIKPGLWQLTIEAAEGNVFYISHRIIKQRIDMIEKEI